MNETTVIEINGVKMEIDLRHAKRIDNLMVGDRVKVLKKGYNDYAVHAGVVIGFEPFDELPTIIIAYVETGYNSTDVKFVYFNTKSKDIEVIKSVDDDKVAIDKASILAQFDRDVRKKQAEIDDIEAKRDYFLKNFQTYWEKVSA